MTANLKKTRDPAGRGTYISKPTSGKPELQGRPGIFSGQNLPLFNNTGYHIFIMDPRFYL
jgi:hypothetical protein